MINSLNAVVQRILGKGGIPLLTMRQLLAVVVLSTAVPLLVLAAVSIQGMISAERRTVRDGLMNNARSLASLVENEIDSHLVLAGTLAASQALREGDLARFERQARKALETIPGAWLSLSDPAGNFVMSTLSVSGEPLPPRGKLDVMGMAWSTGKPQVSDVVTGPLSKRRNAFIEYPVFKDGVPLYSIVVGLNPDRFLQLLRGKGGDDAVIGIVDRKHNFIARIPDHTARVGTPAADGWRAAMTRASEGYTENLTLEGDWSLTAYTPTREGWSIGVAYPFKVLDAPVRRMLWPLGLLAGLTTLASFGLGLGLAGQVTRSMAALKTAAASVGSSEFAVPDRIIVHEVSDITLALSATSRELERRQAELRENEARLRGSRDTFFNLVQHAPFGVFLIDSKFRIVQVSSGAEQTFASVKPVIESDLAAALQTLWPEPFASEAVARFRHTLATGQPYHQSKMQERRRDIEQIEAYDWQIERVTLPDGEHGVVCYYYDLTPQLRAESAQRESEIFARTILDASPDCIKVGGFDGRIEYVNQNGVCLLDMDDSDIVVGRKWEALWPASQRQSINQAIAAAELGQVTQFMAEAPTFRGSIRHWDVTVAPVQSAAGRPVKFIASSRDVTDKLAAEKAVRESDTRFRGTFENAAVGIAHAGLDGKLLDVNQRLCDIVGFTREELQAKTLKDITHPDDLTLDRGHVRQILAGELQSYGIDKRYIRKDGSIVWIGLTVTLRRDDTEAPLYFISIVRDITVRKKSQEHQAFLLRELAHRLKNQLAVIQAMAGQTARSAGSVKEFSASFSQRVQGLAVGIDLLIQGNWTGGNLSDLVLNQLQSFCPSDDRLMCEGGNVSLSAEAIQAIGLALHELATNAVKHGAWSGTTGTVTVLWRLEKDESASVLRLSWVERGGLAVLKPARKGFGHVVIDRMVAQRLDGTVQLAFDPQGFSWELTIPAHHFGDAFRIGTGGWNLP